MPIFDVTVTRTGCAMVEADNINEAMHIAANLPTEEISWTEDWEASDANEIAANASEMGEDMACVHTDPFIKVKILAMDNNWICGASTEDSMFILACVDSPAMLQTNAVHQALSDAGFTVDEQTVEVKNDDTLIYKSIQYTPEALCEIFGIPVWQSWVLQNAKVMAVFLPKTKASKAKNPYEEVKQVLGKYGYTYEMTNVGTIEAIPGWNHKGNDDAAIESLKAIGCTVLKDPTGGLVICLCQK